MRRLRLCTLFAVLTVGLVASASASASTKTYSSGKVNERIPDLGRAVSTIKVTKDAEITDISVDVRISHGADEDLLIGLLGPHHEFTELVSQGQASGENFGTGPKSCGGSFTTFTDGSATGISAGIAPYADFFFPSESLDSEYVGDSSRYKWKLYVFDLNQRDKGTLHCWQLGLTT